MTPFTACRQSFPNGACKSLSLPTAPTTYAICPTRRATPQPSACPTTKPLKAITLNPAQIWGVADKLGSLDVGKTANIVVANGDPLDLKTDVKQVFIEGREVPMTSRQTRLRDQYSGH